MDNIINLIFNGYLGVWLLRILGATLTSLSGHFLIDYTINPKWYHWKHSFLVCFILSIVFIWLDSEGETWRYILKSSLICSGGSMLLFAIGYKYGNSIIKKILHKKR